MYVQGIYLSIGTYIQKIVYIKAVEAVEKSAFNHIRFYFYQCIYSVTVTSARDINNLCLYSI